MSELKAYNNGKNYDQLIRKGTIKNHVYKAQSFAREAKWADAIGELAKINLNGEESSNFPEVLKYKNAYASAKSIELSISSAKSSKSLIKVQVDTERLEGLHPDIKARLITLRIEKKYDLVKAEMDKELDNLDTPIRLWSFGRSRESDIKKKASITKAKDKLKEAKEKLSQENFDELLAIYNINNCDFLIQRAEEMLIAKSAGNETSGSGDREGKKEGIRVEVAKAEKRIYVRSNKKIEKEIIKVNVPVEEIRSIEAVGSEVFLHECKKNEKG
ncbi:hypothetical protein, partial [Candidatus Endomicrobiellum devescovinae]|uniref:hypothetical protein n=1 Tax=Candidatus Endomicrobiellum devescovinae TaxID=3242322 RepID=UPI002818BD98|nr:hypothetical protein [Endomicrobium sp.]